ncbi:MAG: hypothetical protein WAO76_06975 [Georgfuchsia sp.]
MIILGMVINMNEERLDTIKQVEQFLRASAPIEFPAAHYRGVRGQVTCTCSGGLGVVRVNPRPQ